MRGERLRRIVSNIISSERDYRTALLWSAPLLVGDTVFEAVLFTASAVDFFFV